MTTASTAIAAPTASVTPFDSSGTFVALGDSLTSGIGVGLATPPELTWPMRLGAELPGVEVRRLAVSGATSEEVREQQLPEALASRPALASVLVGLNDVLRTRCDADELAENLGSTLSTLRYAGATVLTATMHDPTVQLRLPGPLARRLRTRVERLNDVVRRVTAGDPGIIVVDLAEEPGLADRAAWAPDRAHFSAYGHAVLAAAAGRALGLQMTAVPSPSPGPSDLVHLRWVATCGAHWFINGGARRSLPFLRPGAR